MPDVYAERYIQFRPEDIGNLCQHCHKKLHFLYKRILNRFYDDWNTYELLHKGLPRTNQTEETFQKQAIIETYRLLLITKYEQWILIKKRKRKRKRK